MRRLLTISLLFVGTLVASESVTFSEHVAPIIFQSCSSCHRAGQGAPFALTSYDEVAKRGQFIAAVTKARIMPPWHAAPSDHKFEGERRLSDQQIATIASWVDSGMAKGDLKNLPALPAAAEGWLHGEPDLAVEMTESYEIPADGPDQYRYFVLDLPVAEDRWISAIEFQPTSRTTVHHILGFLVDGENLEADSSGKKYRGVPGTGDRSRVLSWAIGTNPRVLPSDVGFLLKKGQKLAIQTHFHPSGKVEHERSRIGFHFAEKEPPNRYIEVQVPPRFGEISGVIVPPGSDKYSMRESFVLPIDVKAFSTFPHAHYIGKEFELTAHLPNGKSTTLLKVDDFDFTWQELYNFEQYVQLPAGTRLESYVRWDNRSDNPANPYNPPKEIRWGPYSADEMGSIILDVVPANPADAPKLYAALREHDQLSSANFVLSTMDRPFKGPGKPGKSIYRRGREVLARFDKNGDGKFDEREKAAARAFLASKGFDEGAEREPGD